MLESMQGKGLEASFITLCVLIVTMLTFIFLRTYAPSIESHLFPVVSEFNLIETSPINAKEILVRGSMVKKRGECRRESLIAYTMDGQNTIKIPLKIEYLDRNNNEEILFRIIGKQSWGPWKLSSDFNLSGTTLNITSYHNCHGLYLIPTTLLDVPISYSLTKPNLDD